MVENIWKLLKNAAKRRQGENKNVKEERESKNKKKKKHR